MKALLSTHFCHNHGQEGLVNRLVREQSRLFHSYPLPPLSNDAVVISLRWKRLEDHNPKVVGSRGQGRAQAISRMDQLHAQLGRLVGQDRARVNRIASILTLELPQILISRLSRPSSEHQPRGSLLLPPRHLLPRLRRPSTHGLVSKRLLLDPHYPLP